MKGKSTLELFEDDEPDFVMDDPKSMLEDLTQERKPIRS